MKKQIKTTLLMGILLVTTASQSLNANYNYTNEVMLAMAKGVAIIAAGTITVCSTAIATQQFRQANNLRTSTDPKARAFWRTNAVLGSIAAIPNLLFIQHAPKEGLCLAATGAGVYGLACGLKSLVDWIIS